MQIIMLVGKRCADICEFSASRKENKGSFGLKLSPKEVMDSAKDSRAGSYTAMNLTNDETVEDRIFHGTLKLNMLLATLQMVNAICDVAISMSDEELQALSWHDFPDRIREPELIQNLKERSLYKNDPVTAEKKN